jgi:Flp pilus assembly pilin Flp
MNGFSQATSASARISRIRQALPALSAFVRDEEGQDAVEFALVGSWISIVAILALQAIGGDLIRIWTLIRFTLNNLRTTLF